MSERRKNFNEVLGSWMGFIGSLIVTIFALMTLIVGASTFSTFPGTFMEYYAALSSEGLAVANLILVAFLVTFITLAGAILGLVISLIRRRLGVSISGSSLFISFFMIVFGLIIFVFSLLNVQNQVTTHITDLDLRVTLQVSIPIMFYLAAGSTVPICIGAFYMLAARPIPITKYKKKRMAALTKADTFERTGKPGLAMKFYDKAADLSMRLKEEDKATEYYAKSREIHETHIERMLKEEEERKRAELAARRSRLEEERKEILQKADEAEEKEDYQRAFSLYREAADRSVDLGQKKLAAQFTAKAKDLLRKAKELEKEKEKKKQEEKKRAAEYEKTKKEMEKKADKI
ncbi:MAG: hypothetical protein EAX96_05210 [Candidatus Lokiarchaeota archaeon]|nr:hypothetical protein [Candidatus Lokiarchaeota archaeon]